MGFVLKIPIPFPDLLPGRARWVTRPLRPCRALLGSQHPPHLHLLEMTHWTQGAEQAQEWQLDRGPKPALVPQGRVRQKKSVDFSLLIFPGEDGSLLWGLYAGMCRKVLCKLQRAEQMEVLLSRLPPCQFGVPNPDEILGTFTETPFSSWVFSPVLSLVPAILSLQCFLCFVSNPAEGCGWSTCGSVALFSGVARKQKQGGKGSCVGCGDLRLSASLQPSRGRGPLEPGICAQ